MLPPIGALTLILQTLTPLQSHGLPSGPAHGLSSALTAIPITEPVTPPTRLFGSTGHRIPPGAVTAQWQSVIQSAQGRSQGPSRHDFPAYRKILEAAREAPLGQQISMVHRLVNHTLRYREDARLWSSGEHWSTPAETLAWRSGDCEDYAILKYALLRDLGIPDAAMRIVVVSTPEGVHAVLAVRHEAQWIIQDNRFALRQLEQTLTEYTPLFSLNAAAIWSHAPDLDTLSAATETQSFEDATHITLPGTPPQGPLFRTAQWIRGSGQGRRCSQALTVAIRRINRQRKRHELDVVTSYVNEAGHPVREVPCEAVGARRRVRLIAVAMTPGTDEAFPTLSSSRAVELTNRLRHREQRLIRTELGVPLPNRTRVLTPATLDNVRVTAREGSLVVLLDTDTMDPYHPLQSVTQRRLDLLGEFVATRAIPYADALRGMPEFDAAAVEVRFLPGPDTPEEHWRFEFERQALAEFGGGRMDETELLAQSRVFLNGRPDPRDGDPF